MSDRGAGPTGHHRLRVLVVEDELLIADYIALLLEEAGHEVAGMAATAAEALRILDDGTAAVDVASLDVKLPGGVDGVELAAQLLERSGSPFLFVTGSGDPQTHARCRAMRPIAILQKPVDPEALRAALTSVKTEPGAS